MEWWLPFAVIAGALLASMIAPTPRPGRRATYDLDAADDAASFDDPAGDDEGEMYLTRRERRERLRGVRERVVDDLDDEPHAPASVPSEPAPRRADWRDEEIPPRPTPDRLDARAPERRGAPTSPYPDEDRPPTNGAARNGNGGSSPRDLGRRSSRRDDDDRRPPVDRFGVDAPSYYRDPETLDQWPQADAVQDAVRAFLDRWGGATAGESRFRKVEIVSGSNERAFAFVVVIDAKKEGKETTLLARVCVPGENDEALTRIWVTKYFDHIGERFREDVAKTPQHGRGVIVVRDIPGSDGGRGAVALDYEARIDGPDPYDSIRADDVGQYKNLLNIMRMFS